MGLFTNDSDDKRDDNMMQDDDLQSDTGYDTGSTGLTDDDDISGGSGMADDRLSGTRLNDTDSDMLDRGSELRNRDYDTDSEWSDRDEP